MAAVSVRSGLRAWPRPKAEAASQNVEDGRRTWLRVPDGLLVRVPDGLPVRVRRKLLLIYWDFQHIANISRGFTEDRAGHRKHPVSGTRVGENAVLISGVRGQTRQTGCTRWKSKVGGKAPPNAPATSPTSSQRVFIACIFFVCTLYEFFILVALLLPLLGFSQIKWPVSAKSASDTVKQREEQQAKQQPCC